jgi:hypothetical protein
VQTNSGSADCIFERSLTNHVDLPILLIKTK